MVTRPRLAITAAFPWEVLDVGSTADELAWACPACNGLTYANAGAIHILGEPSRCSTCAVSNGRAHSSSSDLLRIEGCTVMGRERATLEPQLALVKGDSFSLRFSVPRDKASGPLACS